MRIGYIHEFHADREMKDWVSANDLQSDDPIVKKVVQGWLYGLNEPWSDTSVHYALHPNFARDVTPETCWVAEYTSIFYDFMQSVAIAYGPTPEEALKNVTQMVEVIIAEYYIPDSEDADEPKPVLTDENIAKVKLMLGLKE